jgi:tetratricopeptide (TPR) repeat protein
LRVRRWLYVLAGAALAGALFWRPLAAWWCLDLGNLAFVRGDRVTAAAYFTQGLRLEPGWHSLLEDHGRAVLDVEPAIALAEFRQADCGEPCLAEAGDAESILGRAQDAVSDYLAAHAVQRLASAVSGLAAARRYDEAIALERALAARLGNGMLAEADLATAYYTIGRLDEQAAARGTERRSEYRADAIRSYRRASQLAPFNEGYLLALGFAESEWGDRRAARAAFERVLDLHPHQSDAERGLLRLGVSLQDAR